ncbi:iron uptake porin [Lyngbya confervoides]|uniref:Iron uptake porin n=1 Tax=Lyngbya confervoides BDU141951 TaxID=1574623 RepID=A0ABD4T792_9CYAN|nr:iron uptake porin [Lyngbya confervoides]MCM1984130.1 iron uptake porin [Lyngbya confervoides BDU141951]
MAISIFFPSPRSAACVSAIAAGSLLGMIPAPAQAAPAEADGLWQPLVQLQGDRPREMGQVTSVNQLSDVQPTDWAFQAVQSLVERYGCVAGYPDGSFRGNRAASRYELAALVNACLDNISDQFATSEDLEQLRALQEEFAMELATLRGRVDGLEARTSTLEAQQFSTLTKLTGEVVLGVGYTGDENNASANGPNPEPGQDRIFFANRTRLTFDTSFSGTDRLRVRLQARTIPNLEDATGTRMARLGFGGTNDNQFQLDELNYQFKPLKNLQLKIDANAGEFQDNIDTINPYLASSSSGALSRFGRFNSIYRQGGGGAGATLNWKINDVVGLTLGYLADEPQNAVSEVGDDPNPPAGASRGGLLFGSYAALAQLMVQPFKQGKFAFTYVKSFDEAGNVDVTSSTGGSTPIFGDRSTRRPFSNTEDTEADHLGFQATFQPADFLNLSGWVGYTFARTADAANNESADLLNWAVSAQFPDLGMEGALGFVIFGQPPKIISADNVDFNGALAGTGQGGTTYHVEAGYKFPVNKNIHITPGVIYLINPEHNSANTDIVIPVIRTTFKF